jgi:hypothetical protein
VMRRVGAGDAFIPAPPRNPSCGLVEGALCHGQRRLMPITSKLTADGAGECVIQNRGTSITSRQKRKGGAAIPRSTEAEGFLAAFL